MQAQIRITSVPTASLKTLVRACLLFLCLYFFKKMKVIESEREKSGEGVGVGVGEGEG